MSIESARSISRWDDISTSSLSIDVNEVSMISLSTEENDLIFWKQQEENVNSKLTRIKAIARRKKYREENREKIRLAARKYRKKNRDKINLKRRISIVKSKGKTAAQAKRYYEKNKVRLYEKNKEYRKNNPELVAAYTKKYAEENKESIAKKKRRYYLSKVKKTFN